MKKLSRNYWRLGWLLLTNGTVILLILSGPIRAHHDQQLLHHVMRTTPPPFSYVHELFSDPWGPILVVTLLAGIVAELRRTILSPILNISPYVVWLVVALRERAKVAGEATTYELSLGKILLIVPLTVVIAIHLIFYIAAFRRRQAEGGDLNLPSGV
jgi:hypothetical protein